jgi:radical SAM protein with 4Fe4S-binding SPASM domain
LSDIIEIGEKYHLFQRGSQTCRYGIYGLTREYFSTDKPPPAPPPTIALKIPPPKLRVMQAVITSRCNLQCTYCSFDANAPDLTIPAMNREELEALAKRFESEIGTDGLLLITGGEPELHREAVDYLIQSISGKIIIFTNGTLTDRSRLEHYQRRGVGVLFSLDGDLFAHDAARLTKGGSFERAAQALRQARDLGMDYGISAVVGDHNIGKLPQLVEYFYEEFHPASVGLNLPHQHHGVAWNRIEEYTEAMLCIFAFAKRVGLFVDQINRRLSPLVYRRFRFRDCAAQGDKIVAFPGGVITSCVDEGALSGRKVDWVRRLPILNQECRSCEAIGICGGGCIFDGEAIYGPGQFDQRNCYFTRTLLNFMIWDMWDELGARANDLAALEEQYGALLKRGQGTRFSVGHETG